MLVWHRVRMEPPRESGEIAGSHSFPIRRHSGGPHLYRAAGAGIGLLDRMPGETSRAKRGKDPG